MRLGRRREPQPPENVRVTLDDDTVIPVDCIYVRRRGGVHYWAAVAPIRLRGRIAQIDIDVLPARTQVKVRFSE